MTWQGFTQRISPQLPWSWACVQLWGTHCCTLSCVLQVTKGVLTFSVPYRLNNLIVQSEPRQAPVASAALGGRQTSTSPHLASAPSPKSPDSAAGEPPSYHTLTSGGQAGRNPSVDDLGMLESLWQSFAESSLECVQKGFLSHTTHY